MVWAPLHWLAIALSKSELDFCYEIEFVVCNGLRQRWTVQRLVWSIIWDWILTLQDEFDMTWYEKDISVDDTKDIGEAFKEYNDRVDKKVYSEGHCRKELRYLGILGVITIHMLRAEMVFGMDVSISQVKMPVQSSTVSTLKLLQLAG